MIPRNPFHDNIGAVETVYSSPSGTIDNIIVP